MSKAQLIVALDIETFEQARKLIDDLGDSVEIFKVGSQMFTAYGPVITHYLQSKGKKVFLDLKFHDIPNTVASAVKSAVGLSVTQAMILLLRLVYADSAYRRRQRNA